MKRPRTPSPEVLAQRPARSQRLVTFRLSDPEHAALLALAERARIGPSAFARRIVEAYIDEHDRRNATDRVATPTQRPRPRKSTAADRRRMTKHYTVER